jgi:NAD(P)-dependent dehydrogenase (short-subunit alcohol dehydrogenase family)
MPSLIGLLRLFKLPFISLTTPAPETFKEKTILISGGASGIGLAAAQHFAHLGASRIILGVHSLEKGSAVAHDLSATSSNADLRVDVWELDLMSLESVVKFAEKCKREAGRIDVAIMNAGKVASKYELSSGGRESVLQVNVLSTALLSCLLLSQLVECAKITRAPA